MIYICPVCHEEITRELEAVIKHTDIHIVDAIKKTHPKWVEGDGACKTCYEWYKKQMKP